MHRKTKPQTWFPTTPACTWWNRPEEYNSSGKLESTHPSRTSVKSDQVFFGVESVMRVNADSLLIRAAATSTSGTLNDLTTDLIMANNNNNKPQTSQRTPNKNTHKYSLVHGLTHRKLILPEKTEANKKYT